MSTHSPRHAPISPTHEAAGNSLDPAFLNLSGTNLPPHHKTTSTSEMESRNAHLEQLRQQLREAKIPLSKNTPGANEVPLYAEDCVLVAGTSRCSLPLCEDSCTQAHHHHRTHARPLSNQAQLLYQRPSISVAATRNGTSGNANGILSQFVSPADSPIGSSANSPTGASSRRQSLGFGFSIGMPRSSVTSAVGGGWGVRSGITTPAHDYLASSPPSPLSESNYNGLNSNSASAPQSPRPQHRTNVSSGDQTRALHSQAALIKPSTNSELVPSSSFLQEQAQMNNQTIQEEANNTQAASSAPTSTATAAQPATTEYWRIRNNHLINLNDYRPGVVGVNTAESITRTDLEAGARDDFLDQVHPSFDPRSPRPPSPVESLQAEVVRMYLNEQDPTKPEIEYELQVQQ